MSDPKRSESTRTCRRCGHEYSLSRTVCPRCGHMPGAPRNPYAAVGPLFFLVQALTFFVAWAVFGLASPAKWYDKYSWVFFNLRQSTSIACGITGTIFFSLVIAAILVKRRVAPPESDEAPDRGARPRRERPAKAGKEAPPPGPPAAQAPPGPATGGTGDKATEAPGDKA
jgi:hypothetical protein